MNKNLKASAWYLFGNLFDKAIAFLTIPIFTRLLTTTEYGIVNTYISYVTILSIILGLSMETSIQTAYHEFENDMKSYISTIILGAGLFSTVLGVFALLGAEMLHIHASMVLIVLAIVQGYMTFVLNASKMYYMMQVSYIKRVILMSVPHTLIAFLSVWGITLLSDNKHMGRIIPYALVIAVFGLAVSITFLLQAKTKFRKKYIKYALVYSLPIVFHALSLQILSQFDKIMLTSLRSAAETGVYSLVFNVGLVSQVFTNAFDNAWLPWFQRKVNEGNRSDAINRNARKLMLVVAVIVSGLVLVAPEIIKVLATEEYWSGIPMVIPIVLASYVMFLYTLEVHTEYSYKRTKQIPVYTLIAAGSNIVLNYIFIPRYGAVAAAYTSLAAYAISFVLHYRAAHLCNEEILPIGLFIKPTAAVLIASVIMYFFMDCWMLRWALSLWIAIAFLAYIKKADLIHTMLAD